MTTFRVGILNCIDHNIEMRKESVQDALDHADKLTDAEAEEVSFELKRIRDLSKLREAIEKNHTFSASQRFTLMGFVVEMLDFEV